MAQQDKKFFFLRTGNSLSVRNELAQLDTLYFQNSSLAVLDTLRTFPVLYNLSKKELYQKILSDIANGNTGTVHPDAYKAYAQNFRHAVNGVFSDNEKYADLQAQFNANVSRFAAYKAYWLTEQLKQYHQESPDNFDNIGKAIINTFNRYQAAEYNTAVARTRTAKQWTDFTSDPTANMLYPNLKWLPSRSANRREEHIPFYGLVLPKTDEFWQHNQPGNLWNCKCDWEETDEQPSSYIPKDIYAKGLEGNPAQTGQIFTDKASYINRAGKINLDEETAKQFKNLQNLIDANPKQWRVDYYTDNKGYLQTSRKRIEEGNINKQEKEKFAKEWNMCKVLADKDHTVIYRESVQGRFDIYLDGVPAELKTTANENNIVKYAKKAIIQQGAKIIVFRFDTPVTKLMWQELNKIKAKKWECYYFIKGDMDVKRL